MKIILILSTILMTSNAFSKDEIYDCLLSYDASNYGAYISKNINIDNLNDSQPQLKINIPNTGETVYGDFYRRAVNTISVQVGFIGGDSLSEAIFDKDANDHGLYIQHQEGDRHISLNCAKI